MKLSHLLVAVAGTTLVSVGAIGAGDEAKQEQSQGRQATQQSMQSPQQGATQGNPGAEVVKQAQEALQAQGYDPGPIDGKMGPKTAQAVKKVQADRELEPSGQLDQRTLAAIGVSDAQSSSTGSSSAGVERQSGAQQPSSEQGSKDRGTCDSLTGPDKELCLREGGSVTTGTGSSRAGRPSAIDDERARTR